MKTEKTQSSENIDAEKINAWDTSVPVEKSSYLIEKAQFLNYENLTMPNNKYAMLDLFCGAGGFAVGCGWAGFQSVFGIDHLQPAMETWMHNHPNSLGCLGDIRSVDPEKVKEMLAAKGINKIHLITGGVPCQGFSRSNRKHIDDDERNFLFLEYMRFVEAFCPDYIILENVSGMRSTAGGKFEKDISNNMEKLGYTTTVKLINAADYGVPQLRQRLVFVGVRRGRSLTDKFQFPEGEFAADTNNSLFEVNKMQHRTVYDAISDLPPLGNGEIISIYQSPAITEYQKLMRGESSALPIKAPTELSNHEAPNHSEETLRMIAATKPGQPMYEKFKQRIRLDYALPSPTQLAGGIRPQFQFGHPGQVRGLSVRERARIQSFPDSYIFKGGTVQERVQTGNAAPPLMIYALAKEIVKDLEQKHHLLDD